MACRVLSSQSGSVADLSQPSEALTQGVVAEADALLADAPAHFRWVHYDIEGYETAHKARIIEAGFCTVVQNYENCADRTGALKEEKHHDSQQLSRVSHSNDLEYCAAMRNNVRFPQYPVS
jgi:hypothetical protein